MRYQVPLVTKAKIEIIVLDEMMEGAIDVIWHKQKTTNREQETMSFPLKIQGA
jgi:hypothetical protein